MRLRQAYSRSDEVHLQQPSLRSSCQLRFDGTAWLMPVPDAEDDTIGASDGKGRVSGGNVMMKPVLTASAAFSLSLASAAAFAQDAKGLWSVYDDALKGAKYIDLTHVIAPNIPVWFGFGPSKFMPTKAGADIEGYAKKGDAYTLREARLRGDALRPRRPISSERSSIRLRTGRRNIHRSTNCRPLMRCGRWWSSPSSTRWRRIPAIICRSPTSRLSRRSTDKFPKARSCSSAPTGRRPGPTRRSQRQNRFPECRSTR